LSCPLFCIRSDNLDKSVSAGFIHSPNGQFMPVFDISINILMVLPLLVIAALAGFLVRSGQLRRKKRQINELEKEMMQAYAELLDTQKDYCELKARLKDEDSPVISIKENKSQDLTKQQQPLPGSSNIRKNGAAS
jgi:hypothetical protein